MLKTYFIYTIFLLCSFICKGQKIEWNYSGDSLPEFKYQFDSVYDSKKEFNSVCALIQEEAFSKGYLAFSINNYHQIDSNTFSGIISLGEQYSWDQISIQIKENILPAYLLPDWKDQLISSKQIGESYKSLLNYYQNSGFPFAEVHLDSITILNEQLSANLVIQPKSYHVFDSITIEGNAKLKTYYLENYLGIQKGKPYNENSFKSISRKIKELPFVELTNKPKIQFKQKKAYITLPLKHRPANFINGILGVLPNTTSALTGGEKSNLVITGDLKLNLGNLFKHGEKIKLNWKRIQAETQQLNTSFETPYLFHTLFGMSYELDLLKQDTSYINFKNKIGLVYSFGAKRSLKAFWENSGTNKLSDFPVNKTQLSSVNGAINSYGIEFVLDERDYKYNPRKGILFEFLAKAGIKKLTGTPTDGKILIPLNETDNVSSAIYAPQSSNIYEAKIGIEAYIPIFKVTSIKIGSNSGWIYNPYLLDNDLSRLGGFQLLRGFDESSIFASTYSIATLEYRILFEQNSHLAVFFDQALIQKTSLTENSIDYPFGFGAGVNFQTKPGIFSVSYAVGRQNNNPIDFSAAKIHFGFINLF